MKVSKFVNYGVFGLLVSVFASGLVFAFGGSNVEVVPTVLQDASYYNDNWHYVPGGPKHTYYGVKASITFRIRQNQPKGSGVKNPAEQVLVFSSLAAAASDPRIQESDRSKIKEYLPREAQFQSDLAKINEEFDAQFRKAKGKMSRSDLVAFDAKVKALIQKYTAGIPNLQVRF
jgi:hypothetical protein